MRPLRHSYTNNVRGDGAVVVKRYEGPDHLLRRRREHSALMHLPDLLPVPRLLAGGDEDALRMAFVAGVHGQELIESGDAARVLRACGGVLRRIHAVEVSTLFIDATTVPGQRDAPDRVIVHGDFGPNNVLLDPADYGVTAVLDWEWMHLGERIEDLAWCEWIVRTHHPRQVDRLDAFFDAYGLRPQWPERHEDMKAQCGRLLAHCRRWSREGVRLWQQRLDATAAWAE